MKAVQLLKTLIFLILLSAPLAAEELDAAAKCDQAYEACVEKCDNAADGSSQCYEQCQEAYDKCLLLAQEQPEQQVQPEQ
ncbi:hypothetical protein [Sulfurimonas sp. HSL3-7]|uniref:hypothetical protein n=1 Tax=Sulfonitrofixus jiaomeiensis TaxID=3131938 RepID=UPI0031F72FEC